MTRQGSVLLAAGGTGGHLFPAFALAEELGRRGIEVDLVTDMRGDQYGGGFPARNVYQVPSATLADRSPISIIRTLWALSRGTLISYQLLGRLKPAVVMGFGGYPTFPPLLAARLRGIPCGVHEQNAVLGRANRMLAKFVNVIATSFAETKYLDGVLTSKMRVTGNPVRQAVHDSAEQVYWAPDQDDGVKLVVFGGSQGARFFSDIVPVALGKVSENSKRRLRVVQQARKEDLQRVREAYKEMQIEAEVEAFFDDLPFRIANAHLVIARSGASTVAELMVIGRPSILVPLPHALDNDQLHNANKLAAAGGAWCLEQKDATADGLATMITDLCGDPVQLKRAADAAKSLSQKDAAVVLANEVEQLMSLDA